MIKPKTHGQTIATTNPMSAANAQLGFEGVPSPVSQYTRKKTSTPMMIPVIRRIIRESSIPRVPGTCGAAPAA
jgi:hypothetical protein